MPKTQTRTPARALGFTLLEMMLALAVLGVLVVSSFNLSLQHSEHFRFDDNLHRLADIRTATIGSLESQVEGCQMISGFVADIGRLPNNISELINCGSLPEWSYDATSGQWSGWRGPYLHTFSEQSGLASFPDGWGNIGDTNNFGWNFIANQTLGTLFVQSLGADGNAGGTSYDTDFPTLKLAVAPREALVDLKGWKVTVHLHNPSSSAGAGPPLPATDTDLRVRIYYPQEGALDWPASWPSLLSERNEAPYLSEVITIAAGTVLDGEVATLTFEFGTEEKLIPYGVRTLGIIDDSDGTPFGDSTQSTWTVTVLSRMQVKPEAIAWNME